MKPEAPRVVSALYSAISNGGHSLGSVPGLLKRTLRDELWREFVTPRGEHVQYDRFVDFVTTPPSKGLGATVELIEKLVASDTEAADLLDQALKNGHGGDRRSQPTNVDNRNVGRPGGTTQAAALRRLRKDAPELHAEVLAGNLSAHAAMVKAGYRPKSVTVRTDRPESIASTLRKHLDAQALARLKDLL